MSLHGRARSRPEGQTRRHERTDHARPDREAWKRGVERTQSRQVVEAAARNDAACHEDARASGTVPVEPDATDVNHAPALGMGAAGAGDRSMTGGSGKRAEIDPEVPGPLPERDAATQSIAMGSNVQFIQTHSRPAGDED